MEQVTIGQSVRYADINLGVLGGYVGTVIAETRPKFCLVKWQRHELPSEELISNLEPTLPSTRLIINDPTDGYLKG